MTSDLAFLDEGGDDIDQIRPGWPKLDPDSLATTGSGVFVAGDLAHGTRLVIDAVASGKRAARSVYQHLTGRTLTADAVTAHIPIERYRREPGYERIRRVPIPVLSPEARLDRHDAVVETGYGRVDAVCEASRCLDCGVTPVFDGARCVLCGGCADVCPTQCLKLVALADVESSPSLDALVTATLGAGIDLAEHTVIIKDEDRCIRCALCAMRCPADAITMERVAVDTRWSAQ